MEIVNGQPTLISLRLRDQGGGGVDASDVRTFGRHRAGKDTLATAEIENALVFRRLEQSQRVGNDDALINFGASFAKDFVIPIRRLLP